MLTLLLAVLLQFGTAPPPALLLAVLLQFGTAPPPAPPPTPIVTPFGTTPASPQPIAPNPTPFGTSAPPTQPPAPVVSPFGTIPGSPQPVIAEDVAKFIATLLYGADARIQMTDTGTAMQFCIGKQQYFPSAIVTFLGTLSNLPRAGQPSTVSWTSCAPSWAQALAQVLSPGQ